LTEGADTISSVTAYTPGDWTDLFVAAAGAAAALTGLIFVAISLNVKEIIEGGGIAERALAAVLELLGVAVISIVALAPESTTAVGVEVLGLATVLTLATIALIAVSVRRRPAGEPSYLFGSLATTVPGTLPLMVGGASLIAQGGGGLYWILAGIVLALGGGVINAWVLLIEILR
jgi:hypothetical protein